MGPAVELDFGVPTGPLVELSNALGERNGFFVFNAGVQVFRAGPDGLGHDLEQWNDPTTWKDAYGGLADDVFCFGQDLFGAQFGIVDGQQVVVMDPETAERQVVGESLEEWAAWLYQEPERHGHAETAYTWQEKFGALDVTERLVHRRPLALGGDHGVDNVLISDGIRLLRALGPLAVTLRDVPPGTPIDFQLE